MPRTCRGGIRRFPSISRSVRKKDEEYWDTWRTAPKAFVPLEVAQTLWGTAYGNVSSVRVPLPAGSSVDAFRDQLTEAIRARLDPVTAGFQIRPARAEALAAADGTTDFGEYFVYFSFFLVVSALLLAALFFALGVEQRHREIGILGAIGFTARDLRRAARRGSRRAGAPREPGSASRARLGTPR